MGLGLRALDQPAEQELADALALARGHDDDGELGRRLVDEPVARRGLAEEAKPAGADAVAALDGEERRVARTSPAVDVAADRHLGVEDVDVPVVGVRKERAHERHVRLPSAANHGHGCRACPIEASPGG